MNYIQIVNLPFGLDKKKNIQQLYLDPIKKVIEQNGGNVYKGFVTPVIFMIDFKTGSSETYNRLKEILKNYESMITVYKGDSVIHQHAINILITGNSPLNPVLKEDSSVVTIDGNINDMNNTAVDKATTRYSSAWENYFSWTGNGIISATEKAKLDSLVAKAHEKKKQIRFYHIPDKPNVWRTLLDAKVDWINTNKLNAYRMFYNNDYIK